MYVVCTHTQMHDDSGRGGAPENCGSWADAVLTAKAASVHIPKVEVMH